MPAVSEKQRRFMALVYNRKKGKLKGNQVSAKVNKASKSMTAAEARDFMKTASERPTLTLGMLVALLSKHASEVASSKPSPEKIDSKTVMNILDTLFPEAGLNAGLLQGGDKIETKPSKDIPSLKVTDAAGKPMKAGIQQK